MVDLGERGYLECHLCERLGPPEVLEGLCDARGELGCALGHPLLDGLPGYWKNETGHLPAAIELYLAGAHLDPNDVALIRSYLRQWVDAPGFRGPLVIRLRARVDDLTTASAIRSWLRDALHAGIDPL